MNNVITCVVEASVECTVSVFHLYKVVGSSETFIATYQIKICHNPEDHNLEVYCNRNFMFEMFSVQYSQDSSFISDFCKSLYFWFGFRSINYKCPLKYLSPCGS
jgi:hypothetical protein